MTRLTVALVPTARLCWLHVLLHSVASTTSLGLLLQMPPKKPTLRGSQSCLRPILILVASLQRLAPMMSRTVSWQLSPPSRPLRLLTFSSQLPSQSQLRRVLVSILLLPYPNAVSDTLKLVAALEERDAFKQASAIANDRTKLKVCRNLNTVVDCELTFAFRNCGMKPTLLVTASSV